MLRLLLVCLIGAWAMRLAMLAAAGFLQGDPRRILCHLPKDNLCEFTCGIMGGSYTSFGHSKGIGSPLPNMYIFLSQP